MNKEPRRLQKTIMTTLLVLSKERPKKISEEDDLRKRPTIGTDEKSNNSSHAYSEVTNTQSRRYNRETGRRTRRVEPTKCSPRYQNECKFKVLLFRFYSNLLHNHTRVTLAMVDVTIILIVTVEFLRARVTSIIVCSI